MSLVFTGGGNYLINASANVELNGSTSVISYGSWARHSTTTSSYFCSLGGALTTVGGMAMRLAVAGDDVDSRVFDTAGSSTGLVNITNNGIALDFGWHHYFSIYDQLAGTLRFFIDGIHVGTDTNIATFPANPLARWVLGRRADLNGNVDLNDGKVAEAFVYDGDISLIPDGLANLQTKQARFVLDDGNLLHYDPLYDQANNAESIGGTLAEGTATPSTYDVDDHPVAISDVSWSLVVIPDTQKGSESNGSDLLFDALDAQFDWIVANQASLGIKHLVHVGDITEDNIAPQWAIIKAQISKLDGKLPYTLCVGNHDYFPSTTEAIYNEFFVKGNNSKNANLVELAPGSMHEGMHTSFVAPDGREIMIAGLQWQPNGGERTAWRNLFQAELLANPDKMIIVVVHAGIAEDLVLSNNGEPIATRPSITSQVLFDEIVSRSANVQMMFCGHAFDGADTDELTGSHASVRLCSDGLGGNKINEILHNAQQLPNGGDGWLRYYEFLKDGVTVRCKTYSPYQDTFETSGRHEFDILLDQKVSLGPTTDKFNNLYTSFLGG